MARGCYTVTISSEEKELLLELIDNKVEFLLGKCDGDIPFNVLTSLIETKSKIEDSVKCYL